METTAFRAWQAGLNEILAKGRPQQSSGKQQIELMNVITTVTSLAEDLLKPAKYLENLGLWEYPPADELASLMLNKRKIPALQYTYGSRLFNYRRQTDQIHESVIPMLKTAPSSGKAVAMVYDPLCKSKHLPDMVYLHFKIADNKLHITGHLASNDFFLGWPALSFQIFKLQELVATELGIPAGFLTTFCNTAYVSEEHLALVKDIISGMPSVN